MSDTGKHPVRVTILNQHYSLRAPGDPREVVEVARSVDELLHSISDRAPSSDSTRIAVLGCLLEVGEVTGSVKSADGVAWRRLPELCQHLRRGDHIVRRAAAGTAG